jgi:hypothetical protein
MSKRWYCNGCMGLFIVIARCFCMQYILMRGRRGRVRMVVGFTTTYAISAYNH